MNSPHVFEGAFRNVSAFGGSAARAPDPRSREESESTESTSGSFTARVFAGPHGPRQYKLFEPRNRANGPRPLIVMLHGCKQDPDDFANGTRMNAIAQEFGAFVLYPAQEMRSNISKCWNWFELSNQQRGAGEPEMLAAMTRHVIATHPIDTRRVYVAGLSAGAAMAAILAREYPELFAAVGVHSGLAPGSAHDVASAFATMKSGPSSYETPEHHAQDETTVPVIVFHGSRDATVHPKHGEKVAGVGFVSTEGLVVDTTERSVSGRRVTRQVIRTGEGSVRAEHWAIHDAGHAWSGGSADGSYTDTSGPDASREMMRFFMSQATPQ